MIVLSNFWQGANTGYKYGDLLARSRPIISITDTGRKQRGGGCGVISIILGIAHSDHHQSLLSRVWIIPQWRPLTSVRVEIMSEDEL